MDRKTELGIKIAQGFERWNRLQKIGGDDPFQSDGAGMNLIRKQIIALKKECEAELESDYPPEYRIDTPAEVKDDYMARPDEIRKNARKSLKIYEKNQDYLWLAEQIGKMGEAEIKETGMIVLNEPTVPKSKRKTDTPAAEEPVRRSTVEETVPKKSRGKKETGSSRELSKGQKKEELPVGQLSMFDIGVI